MMMICEQKVDIYVMKRTNAVPIDPVHLTFGDRRVKKVSIYVLFILY